MGYIYIFGCIFFTVYGQLAIMWAMNTKGQLTGTLADKAIFMTILFLDPWLLSGFVSTYIASLFWMAAMTTFELSFTYPFMSATFILVFILSIFISKNPLLVAKFWYLFL